MVAARQQVADDVVASGERPAAEAQKVMVGAQPVAHEAHKLVAPVAPRHTGQHVMRLGRVGHIECEASLAV